MNFSNRSFGECGPTTLNETFLGSLWQMVRKLYRRRSYNTVVHCGSCDSKLIHHGGSDSKVTHLLDLNDDCLHEIFENLSLIDLCTIVEAKTESSARLKDIALDVFRRSHEIWDFNGTIESTIYEDEKIFLTFGPLVTEIKINFSSSERKKIMYLISRCSNLESLQIENYCISYTEMVILKPILLKLKKLRLNDVTVLGDTGDLFANCQSLVELSVKSIEDNGLICENTFPKLERFTYVTRGYLNLEDFIPRHKNIQIFNVRSRDKLFTYNCTQLNELKIRAAGQAYALESTLESVLAFEHLNKLSIDCYNKNVTFLIKRLTSLKSLEYLSLTSAKGDTEFIPAISKLKKLRWLKLLVCYELTNLNLLADLDQLRVLYVIGRSMSQIDFDIVHIVNRLIYLNSLLFLGTGFRMDKETYLRIVHVVRGRSLEPLIILCLTDDDVADLQDEGHYCNIVQIL